MMITNIICITFVILASIILGIVLQLKKELEINQLKVLNQLQKTLKYLKEVIEHNKDIIEHNQKLTNLLISDINIISFNVKHIKEKIKKL